jgi:hypothetical protein
MKTNNNEEAIVIYIKGETNKSCFVSRQKLAIHLFLYMFRPAMYTQSLLINSRPGLFPRELIGRHTNMTTESTQHLGLRFPHKPS